MKKIFFLLLGIFIQGAVVTDSFAQEKVESAKKEVYASGQVPTNTFTDSACNIGRTNPKANMNEEQGIKTEKNSGAEEI